MFGTIALIVWFAAYALQVQLTISGGWLRFLAAIVALVLFVELVAGHRDWFNR